MFKQHFAFHSQLARSSRRLANVIRLNRADRNYGVRDRGARVLIAACTEFPLVLDETMFDVAFIASTDELAKKTVALALGNIELNN